MKIISFSGKKQSGKTTAVEDLERRIQVSKEAWVFSFAKPLKKIVHDCFGVPWEVIFGTDADKNKPLPCGKSTRELLQIIGTDWFRGLDPDCWVNAYKNAIQEDREDDDTDDGCILITADVRFPNEVKCIQDLGGHVIRLLRNPHDDKHESETALDYLVQCRQSGPVSIMVNRLRFDAVLDNREMSIDEQNEAVWKLVNERGWI